MFYFCFLACFIVYFALTYVSVDLISAFDQNS